MSIRELFNSILDTDISILFGILVFIVLFFMWGSFLYDVFKNIHDTIENWLTKKLDSIEYNSLFLELLMFFPMLFIRIFPTFLLIILGFLFLLLPIIVLDYLDINF